MAPVEIIPIQGALILRARGSELLILQHYVKELKKLESTKEFANFFTSTALVNRPARKLFSAWLRKDSSLWRRIYDMVHKEMEIPEETEQETKEAEQPAESASTSEPADGVSDNSAQVKEKTSEKAETKTPAEESAETKKTKKKSSKNKKTITKSESDTVKKKTATKKKASKKKASKKKTSS